MRPVARGVVFWILVLAAGVALYRWLFPYQPPPSLSDQARLFEDLDANRVGSVTLPREAVMVVQYTQPPPQGRTPEYLVPAPGYEKLLDDLNRRGVAVKVAPPGGGFLPGRFPWLGALFLVVAWIVRVRNARLLREAATRA